MLDRVQLLLFTLDLLLMLMLVLQPLGLPPKATMPLLQKTRLHLQSPVL